MKMKLSFAFTILLISLLCYGAQAFEDKRKFKGSGWSYIKYQVFGPDESSEKTTAEEIIIVPEEKASWWKGWNGGTRKSGLSETTNPGPKPAAESYSPIEDKDTSGRWWTGGSTNYLAKLKRKFSSPMVSTYKITSPESVDDLEDQVEDMLAAEKQEESRKSSWKFWQWGGNDDDGSKVTTEDDDHYVVNKEHGSMPKAMKGNMVPSSYPSKLKPSMMKDEDVNTAEPEPSSWWWSGVSNIFSPKEDQEDLPYSVGDSAKKQYKIATEPVPQPERKPFTSRIKDKFGLSSESLRLTTIMAKGRRLFSSDEKDKSIFNYIFA